MRAARHATLYASALAILAALGAPAALPAAAAEAGAFAPGSGPMQLTRTLRRPLPDGKEVVATRTYAVRFVPDGDGFRIDGELVRVDVMVPPVLESLAEIERKRPDDGMFPLLLDRNGLLQPSVRPASNDAIDKALGVVNSELARMRLAAVDMLEAQNFSRQFRARQQRNQWPADLFRPAPAPQRQVQAIPMGDGSQGRIEIESVARADPASGLLAFYRRTVITDLAGDTRHTIEEWTLAPQP